MARRKTKSKRQVGERVEFPGLNGYDPYANIDLDEYYYDADAGERVIEFFRNELTLTKGKWKGQPFEPFDWAKDVLRCIFGWKRKVDGLRRYETVFIYVPRKNAKSELISGLALYVFTNDDPPEPDNEIYVGARDRGQALTMFKMIDSMRKQNPEMDAETDTHETTKEIRALWDGSIIQAISSDALSAHSKSVGLCVIDELHAQRDGKLIEAMETGIGARQQPIMIYITTADEVGDTICNEELEIAQGVKDGSVLDPSYLPVIYKADPDDDWRSEETWKKANPSYPVTPSKKVLEGAVRKAENSMRKLLSFKRLHLNIQTQALEGWLDMDLWKVCQRDYTEASLEGQKCWGAIDMSQKQDITAFVLLFEGGETVCRFYLPRHTVETEKTGRYAEYVEEGWLTVAGEKTVDYNYILADIRKFKEQYNIRSIAYDAYNATDIVKALDDDGFDVIEFGQSYKYMNEPAKMLEALIINDEVHHNNRVLDWMAANVSVKEDENGNIKPIKAKRGSWKKVDGIICLVMCVGIRATDDGDDDESIYESQGIRTL